jgi:ArsR family transcriptional regulator
MMPSELFPSFANQTRLRLLSPLHDQKEVCVCDLSEVLDERQPKGSRPLAILREAGLLEVRSEGKWKFYGPAQPPTPLHQTLLRCVGTCLAQYEELAADRERLAGIKARIRCS